MATGQPGRPPEPGDREQAGRLVHGQYTTVTHPNMLTLTDRLYEKLPEALTLVQLDFKNGRILLISGNASEGDRAEVTRYNDLLRAVTSEGKPLFSEVKPATMTPRGPLLVWSVEAELRREEGVSP